MDTQTQAQIYLADQRGYSENSSLRSFHTFNFGGYVAEGREPFGTLYVLNDDVLHAGASLTMQVEQPTRVLLLPITGGLAYQYPGSTEDFLEPGQMGILALRAGDTYTLSNPYETESVNCLQLWFATSTPPDGTATSLVHFDLAVQNTLLPLFNPDPADRVFIGRYGGRQEDTYQLTDSANGLFVFVLQGAFEVANRLLQEKDGLSLLDPQHGQIEFEALSDEAILLVIEVAYQ